jgi:hypothetical protein
MKLPSLAGLLVLTTLACPALAQAPGPSARWVLIEGGEKAGSYVDLASVKRTDSQFTANVMSMYAEEEPVRGVAVDGVVGEATVDCAGRRVSWTREVGYSAAGAELFNRLVAKEASSRPRILSGPALLSLCLMMPPGPELGSIAQAIGDSKRSAVYDEMKRWTLPEGPLQMVSGSSDAVFFIDLENTSKGGGFADVRILVVQDPPSRIGENVVRYTLDHWRIDCGKHAHMDLGAIAVGEEGQHLIYTPRSFAEPIDTRSAYDFFRRVLCEGVSLPASNTFRGHAAARAAAEEMIRRNR